MSQTTRTKKTPPRARAFSGRAFLDLSDRLAVIDSVTSLLLRTCDDSIKRLKPGQKECLMAACDDVRAVLGYTGRYLTPRERKRFGVSAFVPPQGGVR